MFEKVACIEDCFRKHSNQPLMYFDSDVIVDDVINEVFEDERWDIAATWRPDSGYGYEEYGVGSWLNAGVLFINNIRPDHSLAFLSEWLKRCERWDDKRWWLDQVELIRLFSNADVDLSAGSDRIGSVIVDGVAVRCKTLHYTVYNFFPEVYTPCPEYEPQKAKVLHLKSSWRKVKFRMLPGSLKSLWITWIKTNYGNNKILRISNLKFNAILRFVLARLRNIR
ncbi:MAG: hypothetical protein DRJ03_08280 [Chloroflexi bacterium]|nr:MAG: hypothetical protein DRJ03_08280 [Chloroflexota bacterium]